MDPMSFLSAIPLIGKAIDLASKIVDAVVELGGKLLDLLQTLADKSGMPKDAQSDFSQAYTTGMERGMRAEGGA